MRFMALFCLAGIVMLPVRGLSHGGVTSEQNRKTSAPEDFVFEAEPREVASGEVAVLRWSIQGATKVTIEEAPESARELQELGTFEGSSGTLQVRPTENTTYIINCEGNTKYSCASLTVRVRVKKR